MANTCFHCRQKFSTSPIEEKLLQDYGMPIPSECPACRRQRRLLFRNFFHLYHRTCSLTGKKIISMYDSRVPFPVYATQEWWSDRWDACSYGITWNPNAALFSQLQILHTSVPRMAVMNTASENTEYCNLCFYSRNCYLVHGCVKSEDCMYGHIVWKSKDCFDCLYLYECERCTECIDCVQCHSLAYSQDCDNCSSSMFLVHCIGCRDCFGCTGLRNKQYCIFNVQHSKQDYEEKLRQLNTGSRRVIALAKERLHALRNNEIVKYYHGAGCENVTGDYLYNSRNICEGYDLKNCEDSAHIATCEGFRDSIDCNFSGTPAEHCVQCLTVQGHSLVGCHTCLQSNANLWYCDNCYSCQDCIGCIGLRNKRYCILNTQYSQKEFESLRLRLLTKMKADGEWGKFLPSSLSPFGYNETIAYHYFPLGVTEAAASGWSWKPELSSDVEQQYLGPEATIPNDIRDVPDGIIGTILCCTVTGKLFKITPQELRYYRSMNLPLPDKCFDARLRERFALRNPRKLWSRNCSQCKADIQTTYAPERPEKVLCEACYQKSVY